MLTERQILQFHTFGFLVLRQILTPDELRSVNEEYENGYSKKDKCDLISGARRQLNWSNFGSDSPGIASLLEDPRFCEIAEQLFGDDVVGVDSNSNHYAGNRSPWHPDLTGHLYGFKFVFYLSPIGANSGALRVIPGSHRPAFSDAIGKLRFKDDHSDSRDDPGFAVNEVPCSICETEPGDAVLFHYHLWHASWGGSKDRRMFSLQYYKNPKTPEEKAAMQAWAGSFRDDQNKPGRIDTQYPQCWLANPRNNPRRARWIDWLRQYQFID